MPNFLLTKLFLNYILIVYLQLSNARQIREGVKKPKVTDQSVNGGGNPLAVTKLGVLSEKEKKIQNVQKNKQKYFINKQKYFMIL